MHSVFLRCEIQATDSTLTGCTAKMAAANHAPGKSKARSTRQTNSALPAGLLTASRIGHVVVSFDPLESSAVFKRRSGQLGL